MAESNPIKHEELVDIQGLRDILKLAIGDVQKFQNELKETFRITQQMLQTNSNSKETKAIEATTNALEESNQARKKQIELELLEAKLQEQLNTTLAAENKLLQEQLKLKVAEQREIDKATKAKQKEEKALKDQTSAYKQASNRLTELRNKYKDLAISGNASEKELKELREEVVKLDKNLKDIEESVGQFGRNVGNYENAINAAATGTGEFGTILSDIKNGLATAKDTFVSAVTDIKNFANEFKNAEGGIEKGKKAFSLFNNVLKASAIGIIIAALASLVAYFKTTEEGSDALGKKIAQLQAVFGELVRTFAKAGPFIIGLFKDIYKIGNAVFQLLAIQGKTVIAVFSGIKDILKDPLNAGKAIEKTTNDINNAVKDLTSSFSELQNLNFGENIKGISNSFSGLGDRIVDATKRAGDIFDLFDELEERQIRYAQELQKIQAEETRLSGIVGDLTTSYIKRRKAEQDLEEVSLQRAKKERDIAREEFNLNLKKISAEADVTEAQLNNALTVGKAEGQVTVDRLKTLNEFYLKAKQADDNLKLQREENLRRQREVEQKQILTREKILQESVETELSSIKKVADASSNSFELRQQAIDEFGRKNIEAFKKEVELINKANGGIIDPSQLINLSGEALDEYIRSLGIEGDKIEKELSDISNKYKKNLAEQLASQEKYYADIEKIRQRNAVAQNKIEQEDFKRAIEIQEKLSKKYEEILSKRAIGEIEKAFDLRKEAITSQAEFELQNAELTAKEKLAIENKLANDLERLEEQKAETIEKINKAIRDKRLTEAQKIADAFVGELRSELQKENAIRQQALDKQISQREQNISTQQALFEQGQQNQLAFEQAQLAKLEQQRKESEERAAKQAEVIALIQATYQSYIARLKGGEKPTTAVLGATGDTVLLRALAKTVSKFWEGTERVEDDLKGNKVHDGRDGYLIGVDGGERILPTHLNNKIGNISNERLAELAYNERIGMAQNIYNSLDLNPVISSIDKLHKEIASRPTQVFRLNELKEIVQMEVTAQYTKKTTIKKDPFK